jgi:hypothetical protein
MLLITQVLHPRFIGASGPKGKSPRSINVICSILNVPIDGLVYRDNCETSAGVLSVSWFMLKIGTEDASLASMAAMPGIRSDANQTAQNAPPA